MLSRLRRVDDRCRGRGGIAPAIEIRVAFDFLNSLKLSSGAGWSGSTFDPQAVLGSHGRRHERPADRARRGELGALLT